MNKSHTILLTITLILFGLAVLAFIIGWRNQFIKMIGVAFVFLSLSATFGMITNWNHVGEASITVRGGGGSPPRVDNKGGVPMSAPSHPNQGPIIHQGDYKKGDDGYWKVILVFVGHILIFLLAGIGLIIWG